MSWKPMYALEMILRNSTLFRMTLNVRNALAILKSRMNDVLTPCPATATLTRPVMTTNPSTAFSFERQYPAMPYPKCLIAISSANNARKMYSKMFEAFTKPFGALWCCAIMRTVLNIIVIVTAKSKTGSSAYR